MEKKEAIRRWQNLEPDQPIIPHFTPIAADARGSTFGACGIRISGNPEFIDAVLSRLKDLLSFEAGSTRLVLSRQPVKTVAIKAGDSVVEKQWKNADTDAETCYIQVRERTARTRQRKVRESSEELPNLNENPSAEVYPSLTETQAEELLGLPDIYKKPEDGDEIIRKSREMAKKHSESNSPDDGFFVSSDEN